MKQEKNHAKRNCFKKMIEKINDRKIIILSVIFVFCFVLGIWGFYRESQNSDALKDIDFLNAVYLTLTLFALNYSDLITDAVLNVARFGASIFTIGGLLIVFGQGVNLIKNYMVGKLRDDSVFVFGQTDEAVQLVESIGERAVTSPKSLLKAKTYVLMGEDEENLKFYYENREQFGERPVYIKTGVFGRVMTSNRSIANESEENHLPNVNAMHTFFSIDEIAAKKYWVNNLPLEQAAEKNYHLDIAIVGFNSLGEELLFQALQMNIFNPNQKITYHLWGESHFTGKEKDIEKEYLACFEATHMNLELLNVVVHHQPWYEDAQLLDKMDRIIVSDYQNAIALVHRMLQVVCVFNTRIDVFYKGVIEEDLFIDHRYGIIKDSVHKTNNKTEKWIQLFNYLEEGCDWKEITSDELVEISKQLNWAWSKDDPELKDGENAETRWAALEAEKRFSNYASACAQYTRSKLVALWNKKEAQKTWKDWCEDLAELEHIRWCNYYWFLNWKFAELGSFEPDKPTARKNTLLRLHYDLRPYSNLPENVKQNDRMQVEIGFQEMEKN